MPATLQHLVTIRSQQAEEILTFLRYLAEALDTTPWVRRNGARLRASEIAVEPLVLIKDERLGHADEERTGDLAWRSPLEEIEAARYELPAPLEERAAVRWRQVLYRERRLGLRGAPGSGKTFITRHTLAALGRRAADQLAHQQIGVEALEVPIWVTAQALAQTSAHEVDEALLEAVERSLALPLSFSLRAWLRQGIHSSRTYLVVDALDELMEKDRTTFMAKARLLDDLPGRVLVTCRTMQWDDRKTWLGWRTLMEGELTPLQRQQQRTFSRQFFAGHPTVAASMRQLLEANVALQHACTTPLLLTFACLLHEEGAITAATTYAQLYASMLRRLVAGSWRGVRPIWVGSTVRLEQCLQWLEGIGWELFVKAPQRNRFTLHDWEQATRAGRKGRGRTPIEPLVFLEELERVGLIVPAGIDSQGDYCWSLAHRTFLEFLAAKALSRRKQQVWLTEARKHLWFQPEWLEVLTFLARLVKDATPLIEAVAQEQDDLFGSMLYLQTRLVGAAVKIDEEVVRKVCHNVCAFWHETLTGWRDCLRRFALPMFAALSRNAFAGPILANYVPVLTGHEADRAYLILEVLSLIGTEWAEERLLELIENENNQSRYEAMTALGRIGTAAAAEQLLALLMQGDTVPAFLECRETWQKLGEIATEDVAEQLLTLTHNEDEGVRWATVVALGEIATEAAAERLVALTHDEDDYVRAALVEALGKIGTEMATEQLVALTHDESSTVRFVAAYELGKLRAKAATERLLSLTHDEDPNVRQYAVQALGEIGAEEATERLLALTHDEDDVLWAVGEALGMLGTAVAAERLLALIHDEESRVRAAVALALGKIGTEIATEQLVALTHDENSRVRCWAAYELGKLRAKAATERLLSLTHDEDPNVRQYAVQALGEIGAEEATERLLTLTHDGELQVRAAVVEALGIIKAKKAAKQLLVLIQQDEYGLVRQKAAIALWQVARQMRKPARA